MFLPVEIFIPADEALRSGCRAVGISGLRAAVQDAIIFREPLMLNLIHMKKIVLGLLVILSTASCTTLRKSASTLDVDDRVAAHASADMVVSQQKVSYSYAPSKKIRRAGMQNAKNAAVSELLKANGNADVLVHAQFETTVRRGLFGQTKIKNVTVSGYPARFTNFRK